LAGQRGPGKFILIIVANRVLLLLMKCVVAALLKEPLVNGQRLRFGMDIVRHPMKTRAFIVAV
jgi:hypothetical protein